VQIHRDKTANINVKSLTV